MKDEYTVIYQEVTMHEFSFKSDSFQNALSEFERCADSNGLDFSKGDIIYGGITKITAPDGTATEYDKSYSELAALAENPSRVCIPLEDGFSLVAEKNMDSDYKEFFVYLLKDSENLVYQDLAIIGENYTYEDSVIPIHGSYSVKVYSDPYDEDWQRDFTFERREEA